MLDAVQLILTLGFLGALAGVVIGLWPRRVGTHPTCSSCGYDLFGLEASDRCPECGTHLHNLGAIELGWRYQKLRIAIASAVLAIVLLGGKYVVARHVEETAAKPVVLIEAIKNGDPQKVDRLLRQDPWLVKSQATGWGTPLAVAVERGSSSMVQRLIDSGADPKVPIRWRWTALHEAAQMGNPEVADVLLRGGADWSAVDLDERTPLHLAATHDARVVQRLLADHAKVDARDRFGRTPLHLAVDQRRFQDQQAPIVSALLTAGADPNAADLTGLTPMHAAAASLDQEIIKLLLRYKGDPLVMDKRSMRPAEYGSAGYVLWKCVAEVAIEQNTLDECIELMRREPKLAGYRDRGEGDSLLHFAAQIGQLRLVEGMLEAKVPVNASGRDLRRPLHVTSDVETARLLLDRGASVHVLDTEGARPLHRAVETGNIELVRLLVSRGADVKVMDRYGCASLEHAVLTGRADAALLEYLASLDAPLDLNSAIALGLTNSVQSTLAGDPKSAVRSRGRALVYPLHVAAMYHRVALAKMLLDAGAPVDVRHQGGERQGRSADRGVTPLMIAAESGDIEMAKLLLNRGAAIDARDGLMRTVLHRACARGTVQMVELLLAHGGRVEWTDQQRNQPLHAAAAAGNDAVIKLLIERGAKPESVNALGMTASQLSDRSRQDNPGSPLRFIETAQ